MIMIISLSPATAAGTTYTDTLMGGKFAALAEAKSLSSNTKLPVISSYSVALKPDLSVYTQDTTIYSDPVQLITWQQAAMTPSKSMSASLGLFLPNDHRRHHLVAPEHHFFFSLIKENLTLSGSF